MLAKSAHQADQTPPLTRSADVRAVRQASVYQEDPEAAVVPGMVSITANPTPKTAKTRDADAAGKHSLKGRHLARY